MKDRLGHGSDAGTHAQGTQATPKLQRRHFEAIAAELRAQAPKGPAKNFLDPNDPRNPQSNAAWDAHNARVNAMADKLAMTNPGFRRDFFVAAATGGDYRFKGPGKNASAVANKAKKFGGSTGMSMSTKKYPVNDGSVNSDPRGVRRPK